MKSMMYHLGLILGKLHTFQYQPFGGLGFQDFSVWAVASFVIPFAGWCHMPIPGSIILSSKC
jgi:hypothetical protein